MLRSNQRSTLYLLLFYHFCFEYQLDFVPQSGYQEGHKKLTAFLFFKVRSHLVILELILNLSLLPCKDVKIYQSEKA